MISRFQKPTSQNISYTPQSVALSPAELADNANHNGYLVLKSGTLEWEQANGTEKVVKTNSLGLIPNSLLPAYVDDVYTYATTAGFPATGESGKIYVAENTGYSFRWDGSAYYNISTQSFYTKSQLDDTFATKVNLTSATRQYIDSDVTIQDNKNFVSPDVYLNRLLRKSDNALMLDVNLSTPRLHCSLNCLNSYFYSAESVQTKFLQSTLNGTTNEITIMGHLIFYPNLKISIKNVQADEIRSEGGDLTMSNLSTGMKLENNMNANSKTISNAYFNTINLNSGQYINFPNASIYSSAGGVIHTQLIKNTTFKTEADATAFTLGDNVSMSKSIHMNNNQIFNCSNAGFDALYNTTGTQSFCMQLEPTEVVIWKNTRLLDKNISGVNKLTATSIDGYTLTSGHQIAFPNASIYSSAGGTLHTQLVKLSNIQAENGTAICSFATGGVTMANTLNMNSNNLWDIASMSCDGLYKKGGTLNMELTTNTNLFYKDIDATNKKVRCLYITANDDNTNLLYTNASGIQLEKNLLCNSKDIKDVNKINEVVYKPIKTVRTTITSTGGTQSYTYYTDAGYSLIAYTCTVDFVPETGSDGSILMTDTSFSFAKSITVDKVIRFVLTVIKD